MKNTFFIIILFAVIMLQYRNGNCQATVTPNTASSNPEFLGWGGGTSKDLDIKNLFTSKDITFTTANGSGVAAQRMVIIGGSNPGYVGIGNSFSNPTSRLTIKEGSGNDAWFQITGDNITTGANHGLRIGVINSGSLDAVFNQQETADMLFNTTGTERMRILSGGNVGINTTAPTSILHTVASGAKTADYTGNLFTNTSTSSTNAITKYGADIISTGNWSGVAAKNVGLHVNATGGTINYSAIFEGGNVGIITTAPDRKLDVLDAGNPQLRLTYTDGSVYSDLQTNTNGHLLLIPSGGNVGIGTAAPTSVLHTVASGAKTTSYSGNFLSNTATSTSGSAVKYGVEVISTGTWTGTNMGNYGASISATGGSNNYGCRATATGSTGNNFGVSGNAINGTGENYGFESISTVTSGGSANRNIGVFVDAVASSSAEHDNYGVYAGASNTNSGGGINYGVYSLASTTGADNYGVFSSASGGTDVNYGVYSVATTSSDNNYGVWASAGSGTNINYGIHATGGDACANNTCTDAAGYFSGDVAMSGNVFQASDAFLKDNVLPLNNASILLSQLSPKTYTYKVQAYPSLHLRSGNHFGLIAGEVEQILPNIVREFIEPEVKDEQGNTIHSEVEFEAVSYSELIPVLIAGYQEQQAQIAALQAQIDNCCAAPRQGQNIQNSGSIELEDMATLKLLQNDPNPFSESTMIRWNIPNDFANAVLYFYDSNGKQINTYKVNSKGAGELQILGSRLSSGVYSYSLVVDGKVIYSKKMVKSSQ